jgi:hypothetical protein
MSTAYDLEGFTSSTLRSKGCGAGVGVEEVCRALVVVAEGGFCLSVPYHLCRCGSSRFWARICKRQENSMRGPSSSRNFNGIGKDMAANVVTELELRFKSLGHHTLKAWQGSLEDGMLRRRALLYQVDIFCVLNFASGSEQSL